MPRSRRAAAEPACRASASRPLCLRVGRLRLRARGCRLGVPGAAPSSLSHSTIRPHEEGRASARTPRPGSDAGLQQVHPAWQGPTPQAALGPQLRPAARARRAHLLSAHSGVAGERCRADTRPGGRGCMTPPTHASRTRSSFIYYPFGGETGLILLPHSSQRSPRQRGGDRWAHDAHGRRGRGRGRGRQVSVSRFEGRLGGAVGTGRAGLAGWRCRRDTIPLSPNTFLAPRRDSQLCREQAAWERPAPEAGRGDGPHPRSAGHGHAALGGT